MQPIRKGDVFWTSWGYDQTNYDFIVVESLSPSGKTATCRMARLAQNESDGYTLAQIPKADGYGKTFRMRIQERYDGTDIELRGTYPLGDGSYGRLDTFYRHKQGKVYYETHPMCGH